MDVPRRATPQPPIRQLALRAFDLSERTARRGRQSAHRSVHRWRQRAFLLTQCAVTAGAAWWVATALIGHPYPFFAAVAAILTIGLSYGERLKRAVQVALGVAVGVGIGELFLHIFGTGVVQVIVVCLTAMSLATLLGAGRILTTQAGVQAIIVTTLPSTFVPSGFGRWTDAAVGCGLALLVAWMAPGSPVRKPLVLAAEVTGDVASTLRAATKALRSRNADEAEAVLTRARSSERALEELDEAAAEGLAVVRSSPFRRTQREQARSYAELAVPLDRLVRNLRVLARRAAVACWRGQVVPASYLRLMDDVAEVTEFMAAEMTAGRLPTAAKERLVVIADGSSHLPMAKTLSAVVILAQLRSMLVDLLQVIGIDNATAREMIPDLD